jgi:hypothetical protein
MSLGIATLSIRITTSTPPGKLREGGHLPCVVPILSDIGLTDGTPTGYGRDFSEYYSMIVLPKSGYILQQFTSGALVGLPDGINVNGNPLARPVSAVFTSKITSPKPPTRHVFLRGCIIRKRCSRGRSVSSCHRICHLCYQHCAILPRQEGEAW